jgi:hypothetical protein
MIIGMVMGVSLSLAEFAINYSMRVREHIVMVKEGLEDKVNGSSVPLHPDLRDQSYSSKDLAFIRSLEQKYDGSIVVISFQGYMYFGCGIDTLHLIKDKLHRNGMHSCFDNHTLNSPLDALIEEISHVDLSQAVMQITKPSQRYERLPSSSLHQTSYELTSIDLENQHQDDLKTSIANTATDAMFDHVNGNGSKHPSPPIALPQPSDSSSSSSTALIIDASAPELHEVVISPSSESIEKVLSEDMVEEVASPASAPSQSLNTETANSRDELSRSNAPVLQLPPELEQRGRDEIAANEAAGQSNDDAFPDNLSDTRSTYSNQSSRSAVTSNQSAIKPKKLAKSQSYRLVGNPLVDTSKLLSTPTISSFKVSPIKPPPTPTPVTPTKQSSYKLAGNPFVDPRKLETTPTSSRNFTPPATTPDGMAIKKSFLMTDNPLAAMKRQSESNTPVTSPVSQVAILRAGFEPKPTNVDRPVSPRPQESLETSPIRRQSAPGTIMQPWMQASSAAAQPPSSSSSASSKSIHTPLLKSVSSYNSLDEQMTAEQPKPAVDHQISLSARANPSNGVVQPAAVMRKEKRVLVLDFSNVIGVDATATRNCFLIIVEAMRKSKIHVAFLNLSPAIADLFKRQGLLSATESFTMREDAVSRDA